LLNFLCQAQLERKASQVKELEEKLHKETELTDRLSREVAASKVSEFFNSEMELHSCFKFDFLFALWTQWLIFLLQPVFSFIIQYVDLSILLC
jgi:hypothetical protein